MANPNATPTRPRALGLVVFLGGGCVMVLELVGSRLMAPYLGTSLFVWTSLIGVILACLSLGYWLGGRLADRNPDAGRLARILLLSGVSVALVALAGDPVLYYVQGAIVDVRLGAVVATLLLFGFPSVLLGMVSPYAVRLRMVHVEEAGSTAGGLYALSTLGSIAGTFLAGFVLLSYFSHRAILFMVSGALILLAPAAGRAFRRAWWVLLLPAVLALSRTTPFVEVVMGPGFVEEHTAYHRVWIYEGYAGDRPIRVLQLNDTGDAAMFLDGDELALDYSRYFRLGGHFKPDLRRALMIGGGAYSFPKHFLVEHPRATIDVVEIDPALTRIAERSFRLRPNPRLRIFDEDARTFLNRTVERYDVVYGDVYLSYSIPFQVATREAMERIHGCLADDGVLLVNVISAVEGPKGQFLRAVLATVESVFPKVLVFAVGTLDDGDARQNLMLVAFKDAGPKRMESENPELNGYLARQWPQPIPRDLPPLTDAHAPVEKYTAAMIADQPERRMGFMRKRILQARRDRNS